MLRFGFVMEQTLGHVTHYQNLAYWAAKRPEICAEWMPIGVRAPDLWERMPVVRGNWSLKASLRARDAMRKESRKAPFNALFLHTQTTTLFAIRTMRRIPTIVSLDATPLNYDTVAEAYGHQPDGQGWLAQRKFEWNQAAFEAATHLITWCEWARDSLISDYGIPASRISVIPPGVDVDAWNFPRAEKDADRSRDQKLRLLFVGGDFERKGGLYLLEAFRTGLQQDCELDIATRDAVAAAAAKDLQGVRVHAGLMPNSPALKDLYANADLFVFPTRADCLPIAVMEAMAAGLPVIATGVGALCEEVEHGVNGFIVPPDRAGAIVEAVMELKRNPTKRRTMGRAGRAMAEARFNARTNYGAVLDQLVHIAAPSVSV